MLDFEASFSAKTKIPVKAKAKVKTKAKVSVQTKPKAKASVQAKPKAKASAPSKPKPAAPKPSTAAKKVAAKLISKIAAPMRATTKRTHTPSPAAKQVAVRLAAKLGERAAAQPKFTFMGKARQSKPTTLQQYASQHGSRKTRGKVSTQASAKASAQGMGRLLSLPLADRIDHAAQVVTKQAKKVTRKFKPKPATRHDEKKALEVVKPIAKACKCEAKPVLAQVRKYLACDGYPNSAADSLLAQIHEVVAQVERAANQRMATSEHNALKKKSDFETQVLERLSRVVACLPPCHPTRVRANRTILQRMAV